MTQDGWDAYNRQKKQRQQQQEALVQRDADNAVDRHHGYMARYPKDPNNDRKLEILKQRQLEASSNGGCALFIIAGAAGLIAAGALLVSSDNASAEPAPEQYNTTTVEDFTYEQMSDGAVESVGSFVVSPLVTIEDSAYGTV